MRFWSLMPLAALALVGWFVRECCLASEGPAGKSLSADVERQVQDIVKAKSAFETADRYRKLFEQIGPEDLRALQTHSRDSIAIQAAWQEVKLTVPDQGLTHAVRPDRRKLEWFLGFLEGRAHVKAPEWWSELLLDVWANRRDNFYSTAGVKENRYHKLGLNETRGPRDTSLVRGGGKVVFRIGTDSISIPEGLLGGFYDVSGMFTPSRCYIAVHNDFGTPFQLACINRTTEKLLWKSEVFGAWWGGTTGISTMWVDVTEQGRGVVVFGAGTIGLHVEAFRPKDGKNLFRFSTSH